MDDTSRRDVDNGHALAVAQFNSFSNQIPVLYFILLANAWIVSFNLRAEAPAALVVYLPIAVSLLCGIRLVRWIRNRSIKPDGATAIRALRTTQWLALGLALLFVTWGFLLFPYGNAYQQGHIAFFLAMTAIGCIFCLMHVRTAALIVTASFGPPFVAFFLASGNATFMAIAVNLALVLAAMVMVVVIYSRDFKALVDSRIAVERKNAETEKLGRENLRLANLDSLTGLANRRSFFAALERALAEARRKGSRVGLGLLDLDGFKPVNDTFGHSVGDSLLAALARRLESASGSGIAVFRLGGDEFALLVEGDGVDQFAEDAYDICAAVSDPFDLGTATVRIGATIGLSTWPDLAASAQDLFEQADYAMYQAKRGGGRGEAWLFTSTYANQMRRGSVVEQALRCADLESELSLVFQPIVEIATGRAIGFEALARWTSRQIGHVSPAEFIPIAEKAGIVGTLTPILLKKALVTAKSWPQPLRLSFNLSIHDISSPESVMRIVSIIGSSDFDPRRVDLEITETAMLSDFASLLSAVQTLKRLGVGISLDDFGTGFSSLRQVHQLPLDKIKIDRSFVTLIHKNQNSQKIVRSLLGLCRDMKLACVVEGVETDEELSVLVDFGCQLVQGYHYSRPMTAVDAMRFIGAPTGAEAA